jgi:uncharacterized SAM-binding protein YcdF (DUF218 family)
MRFKKLLIILVVLALAGAVGYALRYPALRGMATLLIAEDSLQRVPVLFVFSGKPYERGLEAARLLRAGWADKAVCTGEIVPQDFKALKTNVTESGLTRRVILQAGDIDTARVTVALKGTSTYEECIYILDYCRRNNVKTAMLVSSKVHTRRIRRLMNHLLAESDSIRIIVRGAPSLEFNEANWWQNEAGLIFVNNEYVKLAYYALKY